MRTSLAVLLVLLLVGCEVPPDKYTIGPGVVRQVTYFTDGAPKSFVYEQAREVRSIGLCYGSGTAPIWVGMEFDRIELTTGQCSSVIKVIRPQYEH